MNYSILDNDLYKFTMQQAIMQKFPYAKARFEFINRGKHKFTEAMAIDIRQIVDKMIQLNLTGREGFYLKEMCPYLNPVYQDFLNGYQYNPDEVEIEHEGTELKITVEGYWYRTVLWEVPLMAIISEVYNRHTYKNVSYDAQKDCKKFFDLKANDVYFADFGTRRRFSYNNQHRIVSMAMTARTFVGTSNVHFACMNNLKPIGTHAHEWFMFHGAKYGYKEANHLALKNWAEIYHGNLGIALSDTFTTNNFFPAFGSKYSRLFDGVRHDSGDPIEFANTVITHYEACGIDPMTKTIIFSDGLNVDKAIDIKEHCDGKIKCSFGIGTYFTNNLKGVTPMNMVIKMTACKPYNIDKWQPTIKLSDVEGKHTGSLGEISLCKRTLNL